MSGVDLKTAQSLMGYKTISMTARYAHLSSAHLDAAVDRLRVNKSSLRADQVAKLLVNVPGKRPRVVRPNRAPRCKAIAERRALCCAAVLYRAWQLPPCGNLSNSNSKSCGLNSLTTTVSLRCATTMRSPKRERERSRRLPLRQRADFTGTLG